MILATLIRRWRFLPPTATSKLEDLGDHPQLTVFNRNRPVNLRVEEIKPGEVVQQRSAATRIAP